MTSIKETSYIENLSRSRYFQARVIRTLTGAHAEITAYPAAGALTKEDIAAMIEVLEAVEGNLSEG